MIALTPVSTCLSQLKHKTICVSFLLIFDTQHGIPKPTVHKLIKALLEEGVLDTIREAAGRRPAILTFAELLNTLERKRQV